MGLYHFNMSIRGILDSISFATYKSTAEYTKLPAEIEDGKTPKDEKEGVKINEGDEPLKGSETKRFKKILVMIGSCFIMVIITITTISSLKNLKSSDESRIKISNEEEEPVLIYDEIRRREKIECDVPFKFIDDQHKADVVVWSSPHRNLSEFYLDPIHTQTYDQNISSRPLHAFWSLENSEYYPSIKEARERMKLYKDYEKPRFDLEMTYNMKSDIPITYAYSFMDFQRKPKLKFKDKKQDKIASVFISNCSPKNNRTEILKSLMKLLPNQIDSFGRCLNNMNIDETIRELGLDDDIKVNKRSSSSVNNRDDSIRDAHLNLFEKRKVSRWNQKIKIMEHYKFTIAFENADEEDYVTEKYFQALEVGSPPIHLGQNFKQIQKFKPSKNSIINVKDYYNETHQDLKSLSLRILKLSENETLYNDMIDWKYNQTRDIKFNRFWEIVELGQTHEICRLAQFMKGKWKNPYAHHPERYSNYINKILLKNTTLH